MLHKNDFLQLANIHEPHCVSIYLPTTDASKDKIRLKNHIQDAQKILSKTYNLGEREVDRILDPLVKYLDKFNFQSQPETGVVFFAFDGKVKDYAFSNVDFPSRLYVSDHLFLVPLADLVDQEQRLLVLQLSAQNTRLYDVEGSNINEHAASGKLPNSLKDVVGHDVEQKALQYRSGQQGTEGGEQSGMYHGHGSGSEIEKKEEYVKYFREVDRILNEELKDENAPLILACVDYLFPIYQGINTYQHLHPFFMEGNFDEATPDQIHAAIQDDDDLSLSDQRQPDQSKFEGLMSDHMASYMADEIVPASFEGKIQKLLIKSGATLYGTYDEERNNVDFDKVRSVNNASLINFAAVQTIKNGGEVMVLDEDEMPAPSGDVNAIYRYNYSEVE